MFLLSFQPFPVTVIFSLSCPVTCSPSLYFLFLPHSSVPSHPLCLMTDTQSLLCLIFPLSFALSPSSFAPFMRLLPAHPPAFSMILSRAVLLLTSFTSSCFPRTAGEGYMRLDEGRIGNWLWQKRDSKNDWCWKEWEKRLQKSYWVKHLERTQIMSSSFCFGSYKDEVYVISK